MVRARTHVEARPGLLLQPFVLDQLAGQLIEIILEGSGLVGNEFAVSSWLNIRGRATPSSLAADLGLKPTTLSSVLERLVAKGQIRRRPNPEDGRSYLVELTAKGKATHARIFERFNTVAVRLAANLEGDREEILAQMRVLEAAMRRTLETA
jgi:DNA-binding MarR family transcriptional regulator